MNSQQKILEKNKIKTHRLEDILMQIDQKKQINNKFDSFPSFESYFPGLIDLVKNVNTDYDDLQEDFYNYMKEKLPFWEVFSQNKKYMKINRHICLTLYAFLNDPQYRTLSQKEINLYYWIFLFHDIAKQSSPQIKIPDYDGQIRDPAHPYKCCYQSLLELNKLKIIEISQQKLQLWEKLFEQAYTKNEMGVTIHNREYLPNIILFIDKQLDIFQEAKIFLKIILLHQIMPCEKYPPKTPFINEDIELGNYFDENLIEIMRIFWINDSISYQPKQQILRYEQDPFIQEINIIMENYKKKLRDSK